ncbi:MAG: hypothetical protein K6E56_05795 [Lachnospiraceae bacterium]|nr:hypothetical protein [Lachnospiraceae bacterium]
MKRRLFRAEAGRFDEPDPNKKAVVAIVLALLALAELIASVICSYGANLDVGKIHAVLGVAAFIASAAGFGLSISCIRHGGLFKNAPRVAIILTAIVFVLWVVIYVTGIIAF